MNNAVPCVIFAFNRPDKLQRILEALKMQDIEHLIVFIDGPRNEQDAEGVEKCQALARDIDWAGKDLNFREQNYGLFGLIDNINAVLSTYSTAVFLEDDCLPMPGFYSFMCQALAYYKLEEKVFSIGGYQPIPPSYFKNYPYSVVSTARFMCWGWATWRDQWHEVTPYLSRYHELFNNLSCVTDVAGVDIQNMANSVAQGKLESWAIKVSLSALWLNKIHLLPTRGLVRNIGIDTSGAHGGRRTMLRGILYHNKNLSKEILKRHIWLDDVSLNNHYAEKLKEFAIKSSGTSGNPFWRRVREDMGNNF